MKKDYIPIYLTVICYSYTALLAYVLFQTYENGWNAVYAFLLEWQTLVGTILAAFLAGCISFIIYKITKYSEEEQRKRNFIAERAMLPHALSEVSDYCDEVAVIWGKLFNVPDDESDPTENTPKPPLEAFVVFQNCIRHSRPDHVISNFLASIIQDIQVIDSRLKGLTPAGIDWENCIKQLIFICGVRAKTENLFDFARGKTGVIQPIKIEVLELISESLEHGRSLFVNLTPEQSKVIECCNDEPPFEYDPKTGKDSNRD